MNTISSITNIAQIHSLLGLNKPEHPLVTLLDESKMRTSVPQITSPIPSDLYCISLKRGSECTLYYGRRKYDFQKASIIFLAPGQSFKTGSQAESLNDTDFPAWTLVFHPDVLKSTHLAETIYSYTFFDYLVEESLHVSDSEIEILSAYIKAIESECSNSRDSHNNSFIVSYIEILLKWCLRFYERQFNTRNIESNDILVRTEKYLKSYFNSPVRNLLSVKECASELGYSPNYLSDMLKKYTGKSTQEHIYSHILQKAKTRLLSENTAVNTIALELGFEYSQHFSSFFKRKEGITPTQYRKQHSW